MKNCFEPDNILELNKDVEPFVIQASTSRSIFFKDKYVPLQFIHFSDVHAILEEWNRMVEYINYYSEYFSFALHTGDYCNDRQESYTDLYSLGTPCSKPIFNCVGNHDTFTEGYARGTKEAAHKLLFNKTDDWGVTFMERECSMTYYKDFPESNIRLIVLDLYYDVKEQETWLTQILADAKEQNLQVITAMHEPSGYITQTFDTTFHSINDYYTSLCPKARTKSYEKIIAEFKENGGIHICNLCGHEHHDLFGYTDNGILNVVVECATFWPHWCDGKRVKGTRTFDCFNVMSVDVNLGHFKIVRIGDNADNFLRIKQVMCFDYINKKMIFTK